MRAVTQARWLAVGCPGVWRLPKRDPSVNHGLWLLALLLVLLVNSTPGKAQTIPPSVTCVRSFTSDLPDQPLVSVFVYGASNSFCVAYEELLPIGASAISVSGGGIYLPTQNAVRWGPYFGPNTLNLSYRLGGLPGMHSVAGGAWVDGQYFFSPGTTLIPVSTAGPGPQLAPPPQTATPIFTPASGASVPTNLTISCSTPNAAIYFTLDGSLPTQSSMLYTGAVSIPSLSVIRAVAFTNGWTPSVAALGYYGFPPAPTADVLVMRTITTNFVVLQLVPGTNAACVALIEALPPGLSATSVSTGGNFIASNNVVLWGPFFGTNAQTLSYQAMGRPGVYPVQATWSVDGVGGEEATAANLVLGGGNFIPTPPPQVAPPVFLPASGTTVPSSVTITDATPGAAIYYTLDGSLPTPSSAPYTGAISITNASVIRAVAFTNGWFPSVASVAYYGPPVPAVNAQVTRSIADSPTGPVVTFTVTPGVGAQCIAVTDTLPPGVSAINVSTGGTYIASNNVVHWGPFFGASALSLSYQAAGLPGTYPVQASWSVDGLGGSEPGGATLVIGGGNPIPQPPQQVPSPVLSPAIGSNLPVNVTISCPDAQAQIYYTLDGTLPTPASPRYTGPLTFNARATLRAVAFRNGYLPSVAVVGEYVPAPAISKVSLSGTVANDDSFLPRITLVAAPQSSVNCYAVVEPLPAGLTPSDISGDGFWDPLAGEIRWGPYLDNQPRQFSFDLAGPSGIFPLAGEVSVNGYSMAAMGASLVRIDDYSPGPPTPPPFGCATDSLTYTVNIDPSPGVVFVTAATGTVNWGDGTQSAITRPDAIFQKQYTNAGTFNITISADWTGYTASLPSVSGHANKTDSVVVVTNCLPPQILTQPANQVVYVGATAQFSVDAASSVPMTYQWYFDQSFPIVGTIFSTLTLPDVEPQSAGNYAVVLANSFGSTTSLVASLTVVNPFQRNPDGSVTLNLINSSNSTSRILATTNLAPPVFWQPIFTNSSTVAGGVAQFNDTNAINLPMRFYQQVHP